MFPLVAIATPVKPPSATTVMVISVSITATPFNVSFVVTSPATPPVYPFTVDKSAGVASLLATITLVTVKFADKDWTFAQI